MSQKHLLISAAGTGGHVMPGLAVARELARRGWRISWIGTQTGMEGALVARDGIAFTGLDFQGVRGKGLFGMVKGMVKLVLASRRATEVIRTMKPDVLFTTGGYVAVPVCNGARKNHTPVVLMNCDADLLLSSKMVMDQARAVACGFAGSARSAANGKGSITGNPVRAEIEALASPEERLAGRTGPLRLLVFGGSLGAQVLNDTVPRALALFDDEHRPVVVHQTGAKNIDKVKALYDELGIKAEVTGFIDDMAGAYRESDIVLCRSGAMTVSELCAAGAASILVPFVVKTTKHQLGNARYMQQNGAAVLLEQEHLTPEHLFGILMSMKREKILGMAVKARSLARLQAASRVADMIEEVASGAK